MRRISAIRSHREAELEKHREDLRNIRWARRRSQLLTAGIVFSTIGVAASGSSHGLVDVFRTLTGL